jgi:putative multiple sugar transport system ATP-binding protein
VRDIGVGKQQLVEIAKALSKEVKLLILDEPTAALNDEDSAHLLDLLRGPARRGHHLRDHLAQAERDRGDRRHHHHPARRPHDRDAATRRGGVTEDRIIAGMVGRDLEHRFPPHEPHIGEEVLRIEDWTVHSPTQPDRVVVAGRTSRCAAARSSGWPG